MVKLWGTTIEETINAFKGAHLGTKKTKETDTEKVKRKADALEEKRKATVRIIITFIVLLAGIFFIGYNHGTSQTMGAAMVGAVTGYWLK